MTYQLAKQLKDAGFPQTESGAMYWCTDAGERTYSQDCKPYSKATCGNHEKIKFPTLSELIESCGDLFWELKLTHDGEWKRKYFCVGSNQDEGEAPFFDTPEEAVARLWLIQNKSSDPHK